ncbi:MAG TPA: hypothetical protein VFB58_15980 [Chloroflexota bacterium]|nr:hypothetical protein [Chloroflexota bacterium]
MPSILSDPAHLHLDHIRLNADVITSVVARKQDHAPRPLCGRGAVRVHSDYVPMLARLPRNGVAGRLHLTVRRFLCKIEGCPRRIFAARFRALAAPHARRANPLVDMSSWLALPPVARRVPGSPRH